MADSPPLLSNSAPSSDLANNGFRWSQVLQVILISMASFFEAQQTFITIFTDAKPSWHCTQNADAICNSQSNICQLPPDSWQWDKPASTSIISEWSLQCTSSQVVAGLPSSSFFVGSLLGGLILSFHGDSLGQKKLLVLSCLTMSIASVSIAFSRNIWDYSVLRMLSGFGHAAIGSCVLVLSTESVGKEWRSQVGIIGLFCSIFGFLSLPTIAYFDRSYSWRTLYFLTSIPATIYSMVIQLFVYEPAKWLLQQGKIPESLAALNIDIDPNSNYTLSFSMVNSNQKRRQKVDSDRSLMGTLLKDRYIFQQLTLAMLVGFGIGVIYYGMPVGVGNLDFDHYLSIAFNAMLEIPSAVMIYLVKCRHRSLLLALATISCACGIASIMVGRGLQIGLEVTSFFSSCVVFNLLLIYTVELLSISTRLSTLSKVWQAVMLSGAISPLAIAVGGDYYKILLHLLGVLVLILGSLVIFLQETSMSGTLSVTLDEQQQEQEKEHDGSNLSIQV